MGEEIQAMGDVIWDTLLFRVRLSLVLRLEPEFELPSERGTPLAALDPVRDALLHTHQKRRISPFPPEN